MSTTSRSTLRLVYDQLKRDPITVTHINYRTMMSSSYSGREFVDFTIFPESTESVVTAVQDLMAQDKKADRAVGAVVGLALGDAVGHPLEFVPAMGHNGNADELRADTRRSLCDFAPGGEIKYYNCYNKFRLMPGQWTDDAAMSFCLGDSLLVHPHYQGGDCRGRYHMWWHHGYNNAFRHVPERTSVGLGGNISKSLDETMRWAGKPLTEIPEAFNSTGEDAGNGSIMRLAPVPVRFWNVNDDAVRKQGFDVAVRQSRGTHPGNDAAACCVFLTYVVSSAISRPVDDTTTIDAFLEKTIDDFFRLGVPEDSGITKLRQLLLRDQTQADKEACWNWRKDRLDVELTLKARGRKYNGYPVDAGYFGAYCMDGLAMAMWSLYHSKNYAQVIFNVVNMLGDADTTGAIAGQVAGAFYGYSGIAATEHGDTMLKNMYQWDKAGEIPLRGALLYLTEEFLKG